MGALACLTCAVLWSIGSLLFQRAGRSLSAVSMNLIKCAVGGVLMSITLWAQTGHLWPTGISGRELALLALSAVVGLTLGDSFYFAAMLRIGPRRALLASSVMPVMTAAAAWILLGEQMGAIQMLGSAVVLGGIAWALTGQADVREPAIDRRTMVGGLALTVAAAACQVMTNLVTKQAGSHLSALDVGVVRLAFGSLALALHLTFAEGWGPTLRGLREPRIAASIGGGLMLGTYIGVWLMNYGLMNAPAGVASTLLSTSPIWILAVSRVALGHHVPLRGWLGAGVAVGGVAMLAWS